LLLGNEQFTLIRKKKWKLICSYSADKNRTELISDFRSRVSKWILKVDFFCGHFLRTFFAEFF
jgi:hypothetical protein